MEILSNDIVVDGFGPNIRLWQYDSLLKQNLEVADYHLRLGKTNLAVNVASCGRLLAHADGRLFRVAYCRMHKSCLICGTIRHMKIAEAYSKGIFQYLEESSRQGNITRKSRFSVCSLLVTTDATFELRTAAMRTSAIELFRRQFLPCFSKFAKATERSSGFKPQFFSSIHVNARTIDSTTTKYAPHIHFCLLLKKGKSKSCLPEIIRQYLEQLSPVLYEQAEIGIMLHKPEYGEFSFSGVRGRIRNACEYLARNALAAGGYLKTVPRADGVAKTRRGSEVDQAEEIPRSPAEVVKSLTESQLLDPLCCTLAVKSDVNLPHHPSCPEEFRRSLILLLPDDSPWNRPTCKRVRSACAESAEAELILCCDRFLCPNNGK